MKVEYGFILFTILAIAVRFVGRRSIAELILLTASLILLTLLYFHGSFVEAGTVLGMVLVHWVFLRFRARIGHWMAYVLPVVIFFSVRDFSGLKIIGLSYLFFRMLSATIEVGSNRVHQVTLRQYLSYCFFFFTFKMGPVGTLRDHLESEEIQSKKPWYELNWLQLFRAIFGLVKYVFLVGYVRNFFAAFGFQEWEMAGSLLDLVILGFASYLSVYLAFSGFNDIAIGLSHFLSYRMKENFAHPFRAKNIGEFWSNWHISITDLLKDLIFFPLSVMAMRRLKSWEMYLVMPVIYLALFTAINIWHGKGMNFLLLGLYHAAGATIAYYFSEVMNKLWKGYRRSKVVGFLSMILTQAFISLSWFFFDNDIEAIGRILSKLQ